MRMTRNAGMELMMEKVVLKAIQSIVVTGDVWWLKGFMLIWFVK